MNLLLEKKILGTFTKFCEKNVLCEKGDEITRFDGTPQGCLCIQFSLITIIANTSFPVTFMYISLLLRLQPIHPSQERLCTVLSYYDYSQYIQPLRRTKATQAYSPPTRPSANAGMKRTSVVEHNLFRKARDRGINQRSKPKGLRQN